jgi:peptidoglycan/xylan/chitin deacetylase (PgdA/CDA1 family)
MVKTWSRRAVVAGGVATGMGMLAAPAVTHAQDVGDWIVGRHTDPGAPPIALPTDIVPNSAVTITRGLPHVHAVALTFDDGPHPSLTPRLLDMLKARGMVATFYVIGVLVRRYPDILRRIVDEGHEIGNHTYRHPNLAQHGSARVLREIDRTQDAVDSVIHLAPRTMRPPYGALTRRQRLMLHRDRDLPTVMWSVDPQDWRRPGSSVVAERMLTRAHNGAIMLAHDIHAPTVAAMPAVFDGLLRRGYETRTVSTILGRDAWRPPEKRSPFDVEFM